MNKATAKSTLNKSYEMSGIDAARLALGAQRMFNKCRFATRRSMAALAQARAIGVSQAILEYSKDQSERSEAGRIISESRFIGW